MDTDLTGPTGLTEGPRGRRLVLELAAGADEDVRMALFYLAYNAAVASGHSVALFGAADDGSTFETHDTVESPHSEEGLVRAIGRLGRLHPTSEELQEALRRSVDAAAYWQPPSGEDIVAALPAVRAALAEAGRDLVDRADTVWWTRDMTVTQWAVEFDPDGDGAPFGPAPGAVRAWREATAKDEERSRRDRPTDPAAAWSGTWWSHPWGAPHTTGELPGGLPVGIPNVEDSFGWTRAVAIPVRGTGRILEVRDGRDWANLCRTYPLEVTAARRHDWYRVTGRDRRWLVPDWMRVAEEWDAVHLSAWAYLTAATREIVVDEERSSVIGGWAPDETYWLTGRVREVEGPRVHWRADDQEGPWRRTGDA